MPRPYFHLLLGLLNPGHPYPGTGIDRRPRPWCFKHVRTRVQRPERIDVSCDFAPGFQNTLSVNRVPISIHIWMQPLEKTLHMAPSQFARSVWWKAKNAV